MVLDPISQLSGPHKQDILDVWGIHKEAVIFLGSSLD